MKKAASLWVPLGWLVAVLLLDQASKAAVLAHFSLYESLPVIPGFFNLTYLVNTGAAFGLLAGEPTLWRQCFFGGVAVLALAILFFSFRQLKDQGSLFAHAIGLIAGGAVGNLIDRLRFGAVVDFFDVYVGTYHWPAFNVADSAITIGVGLFLLAGWRTPPNTGQIHH